MADVTLRKVVKRYDEVEAVRGIDLDIADHEFVVLVGPSGCGKSTTLRMIAGLEDITDGDIMIGGDVVNDVPPKDRDIAMVFQNYALYPHMTVAENMSFGLRLKRYPKAEIKTRIDEAARMLDIVELVDRKPKQLSGGQRQRVAMGRAIVRNPEGVPVRRTAVQPRRQAAGADADRDQEGAPEGPHHHGLRHPRPGRGDDAGRPGRGHEPRPHRTDRHAERTLSQSGHALRRRLHRLAGDELHALPAGGRRRQTAHPADRPHRLPAAAGARRQVPGRRREPTSCSSACGPNIITEANAHPEPGVENFDAVLDVTEPMGMETLIYFTLEGAQICGRVNPNAGAEDGAPLRLAVDLNNMHLLNEATGVVL